MTTAEEAYKESLDSEETALKQLLRSAREKPVVSRVLPLAVKHSQVKRELEEAETMTDYHSESLDKVLDEVESFIRDFQEGWG